MSPLKEEEGLRLRTAATLPHGHSHYRILGCLSHQQQVLAALGPKIGRNRRKIPKLSMSLALQINAQLTHPLYDGSRKPKKELPGTQRAGSLEEKG
jgi:hypothetical protein